MNMNKPVSKVLVLDDCPAHKEALKRFCDENNLVGVKVGKNRLQSVLRSNIDLGAVLFAESYGGSPEASAGPPGDLRRIQLQVLDNRSQRQRRQKR